MKRVLGRIYLLILVFMIPFIVNAAQNQNNEDTFINILHDSYIHIPNDESVTINNLINTPHDFKKLGAGLINLAKYNHGVWIRTTLPVGINVERFTEILIDQTRIKEAEVFFVRDKNVISQVRYTNYGIIASPGQVGNLNTFTLPPNFGGEGSTIYFKLNTPDVVMTPIFIGTKDSALSTFSIRDVFFGIYTGIMLIMFAYNMFLYLSIKDTSYLNYIFCILFTWLTQITLQGYGNKYFHIDSVFFNEISVILFSNLGLVASILFTKSFLNTKENSPVSHQLLNVICLVTALGTVSLFFGFFGAAFIGMQLSIMASAAIAFVAAFNIYFKKQFKPAGYYLISWTFLFIGMTIFILKDYELIGYSLFTTYSAQFASVAEVLLLSFALADRINFFKKENELAQKRALLISKENEQLILQQNIELEKKVNERTEALQETNSELNAALSNLKSTQSQLVDAEKMAALGQLTAGIAHEINNPINFVTSNIKPLQLDIDDLKEIISRYEKIDFSNGNIEEQIKEIDAFKKQIDLEFINNEIEGLLTGISDGAKRTAEIIRSLRNFSRLDEDDLKPIDINEGLHSTLVLVKNTMPDNLKVVKDFGNLPKIECLPGKINQVFMNLISNAIQAIKSNGKDREEELLSISTWYEDNSGVKISIKDTGTGMTDQVKHKIFEPFFTTKEVGEGTGLGLSIVFSIIEKHKGHINVLSEVDQGTEFIITLPVNTQ